jgi:hypothetical protein
VAGSTRADAPAFVPERRWQRVQWQYTATEGGASSAKRTVPQPHPPVSGRDSGEDMAQP